MVEQGLRDLAADFAEHGPGYANRYVDFMMGARTTPPVPRGVHPSIAAAIRDVVIDQAYVAGVRTARIR